MCIRDRKRTLRCVMLLRAAERRKVIVAIHNNMNEKAWKEVMEFEQLCHPESVDDVTLLKFIGRPDELTPIAWVKSWIGYGMPFDRHDWTIDRNGTEVRYVIDYYYDETKCVSHT
eukprot:TRINITY_DN11283_c0_g1_i2.p2 TRINITY_DN11283_c0_g1~~TRINITY_DN11283_c0_g1_i2.p2  ORF type:complete len:115 (+),score=23.45 TRINITY_DN11283_c0_g1_i2:132-476(+)